MHHSNNSTVLHRRLHVTRNGQEFEVDTTLRFHHPEQSFGPRREEGGFCHPAWVQVVKCRVVPPASLALSDEQIREATENAAARECGVIADEFAVPHLD